MIRNPIQTIAICKRCSVKVAYHRRGRLRYYCQKCKYLEARENTIFANDQAKIRRAQARGETV